MGQDMGEKLLEVRAEGGAMQVREVRAGDSQIPQGQALAGG